MHWLSWADFDALARGSGGPPLVRKLRRAERSRRLLLLRALTDEVTKLPELGGPLPPLDTAWELLARVQQQAPRVLDRLLGHPYTGSWAGYTTRLLRNQIDGVCPLWMHVGHLHAMAAAAGIWAGLAFETEIPVWHGRAILPTLGLAHVFPDSPCSMAEVRSDGHAVEVTTQTSRIRLSDDRLADGPGWWSIRRLRANTGGCRIAVRLDDVDPYRGLSEPVVPQRLSEHEVDAWRRLLSRAWQLIVRLLPDHAHSMTVGFDSLVPRPAVPFGNLSASTGEAFGSAVIAMPADAASLAATLVHEFHHTRLAGLLHLTQLYDEDPRERFYTPWRDDPRPIGGVLQGVYAFFGVTAFWRALSNSPGKHDADRANFEFAYWRAGTWRTLNALHSDPYLTDAGRRFIDRIAEQLGPWQDEPLPRSATDLAEVGAADDYAGWRIRYLRPSSEIVHRLADSWLAGRTWPVGLFLDRDPAPTPVPDGTWTTARLQLIRLKVSRARLDVPDCTMADRAYVGAQADEAVEGYRAELTADPDRAMSWIGLGLALAATRTNPSAAWALLHYPEIVRAVHRRIRKLTIQAPDPDELATWIGRYTH
ncbi:HEXXH motif domain-containing protein [Kibdelosporangium aridum]|uniref:HEXXH motif domain-containing protein n=2 Tax=Kibdelosporangium aridum TaxID=2030 RepID=A0A428Y8Q3_KIBAR|nr:HEXXH motif domain-containing protein [Kibdelosporangium aridum]